MHGTLLELYIVLCRFILPWSKSKLCLLWVFAALFLVGKVHTIYFVLIFLLSEASFLGFFFSFMFVCSSCLLLGIECNYKPKLKLFLEDKIKAWADENRFIRMSLPLLEGSQVIGTIEFWSRSYAFFISRIMNFVRNLCLKKNVRMTIFCFLSWKENKQFIFRTFINWEKSLSLRSVEK